MSRQDLKNLDKAKEEGRVEEYLEEYYKRQGKKRVLQNPYKQGL